MAISYHPKFEFDLDTKSHQLMGPSLDMVREDLLLAFYRDVEGKIRQALIDIGWTPPGGAASAMRIAELEAAMVNLLRATSSQVVMRPSERDAWRAAEAVMMKADAPPRD